ncbi:MAG: aminotransferase class I/II-fold pyridoxal phosphate-dependent enzyme, partial [Victivallales bacterium]|nr:aminotransferase class I/II-fold pyridoxal phosphate-dependent enzyme [Victivallales bacterium]
MIIVTDGGREGFTMNEMDEHGGNLAAVAARSGLSNLPNEVLDFSVNVNPFGIPLELERTFQSLSELDLAVYPEPHAGSARARFAVSHGIPADELILGNGSMELFQLLLLALKPSRAVLAAPCYSGYAEACRSAGIETRIGATAAASSKFALDPVEITLSDGEALFLASPNNPTGTMVPPESILRLASDFPNAFVVLDESFIDFVVNGRSTSLFTLDEIPANLAVIKSMTKFHAIPGARLGAMRASSTTISAATAVQLPWSVNALAQKLAAVITPETGSPTETADKIRELRSTMIEELPGTEIQDGENAATVDSSNFLRIYPSESNFILC